MDRHVEDLAEGFPAVFYVAGVEARGWNGALEVGDVVGEMFCRRIGRRPFERKEGKASNVQIDIEITASYVISK